ncbi:MAG: hypothetical protein JWQ98_1929 [Chlorobi bacterium]|nr:hypothetical protein [Chlorobiota bacterium]
MQRSFLLLLLGLALAACTTTTDPGGTNTPASTTAAMKQITDLPMAGGDVTSLAIAADNSIIAAIDGKLYSMSASGGAMNLISNDPVHTTIGLAPSGELYAVTDRNFRTYDLSSGSHRDVPIDPAGPFAQNRYITESEIIFSPAGEPYVKLINNTPQMYVYHSTDKGASWAALKLPPAFKYGGGLAFAPNGDILVTGAFGFFRSSDGGATWATYPAPQPNYAASLYVTANGDIYHYVRGGGGLLVSRNGGASFTELAKFNAAPFFTSLRQGADGALYALANQSAGSFELIRSTDGGATWRHAMFAQGHDLALRGSSIAVGLTAMGLGTTKDHGGIVVSRDNGGTWTSMGTGPVARVTDIGLDRDGNLMIFADNGLFRQTSSGWQALGTQPGAFARFASSPQGVFLLANTASVFRSSDNGATWTESPILNYQPGIDPASITSLFAMKKGSGEFLVSITSYSDGRGYTNGQMYRVGADGKPVKMSGSTATLATIVQDRDGVLYGGSSTLDPFTYTFTGRGYTSSDGGATWTEVPKAMSISALAFNSQNRYLTTAGMSGGYGLGTPGSDQKTTLKLDGFTSPGNYISRVMFGPDDRLYIVALDKGLFVSNGPVR